MFRRGFWRFALVLLVLLAAAAMVSSAHQRNAWLAGYMMGQAVAGGQAAPLPQGSGLYSPLGMHRSLVAPLLLLGGGLLALGLLALPALVLIGRHRWSAGPAGAASRHEHWRQHWQEYHRHAPCWCRPEPTPEPETKKPEPPAEEPR